MKKYLTRIIGGILIVVIFVAFVSAVAGHSVDNDPYLRNNVVRVEMYSEYMYRGSGSGFLYEDGKIMTAGHVVEDANSFLIIYPDGAEEWATDYVMSRYDLGIIYVDRECDENVSWNISLLEQGDTIFTNGFPFGIDIMRVSKGIVSSLEWSVYIWPTVIIVDADIERGNSGGPLIDTNGRVCGVIVGGQGNLVLCVPGRIVYDFVMNPEGDDHEEEATDFTETIEETRWGLFPIHTP